MLIGGSNERMAERNAQMHEDYGRAYLTPARDNKSKNLFLKVFLVGVIWLGVGNSRKGLEYMGRSSFFSVKNGTYQSCHCHFHCHWLRFSLGLFFWGGRLGPLGPGPLRKINQEKIKANGNGNFDRYHF